MIKDEFYILNNNVKIPKVGFGTWQSKSGEEAYQSTLWALQYGYRHIDTAYVYGNEESVGQAIIDSKIPREEIFITTKLPAEIKDYHQTFDYFNQSLKNLKTDYVDLYLIHAPWSWSEVGKDCTAGNIEAWKAMIELYKSKKVRAIGVSNFHVSDIKAIVNATGVWPAVNQIRYFIGNTQPEITDYCQQNNVLIEAYSPLATGELIGNKLVEKMADKYHTTIANICLQYCISKGTLPLPKSVHEERIRDNLNFDFKLEEEDLKYLDSLYHIVSTRRLRD